MYAGEASSLLSKPHALNEPATTPRPWLSWPRRRKQLVLWLLLIGLGIGILRRCWYKSHASTAAHSSRDVSLLVSSGGDREHPFSDKFVWGVATSAYQIEGAVEEDGRGLTIWDTFVQRPNVVLDNSTGNIADDHYHRWKDDVALMKQLDVKSYRFSLAWSRILPNGRTNSEQRGVNEAGIQFYDKLIDELLANDIEPWITLFHWDLPQALQDEFGGWTSPHTVTAFCEYARIVFERFGHKVKRFITLNEPWT
jgi:Glycosyl hydrolase family 1